MSGNRAVRAGLLGFGLLGGIVGRGSAQVVLAGRVVTDSTKAPIPAAEVVIEASGKQTRTDADGRFVLPGLPSGIGFVLVRKIGYRPIRLKTLVFGSDTLEVTVQLKQAVVELEPLEVVATAVPPGMDAYAERRLQGMGSYLDADLLRRSEHRLPSDMLREVRGVAITRDRFGHPIAISSRSHCPMAVWIDGVRSYTPGQRQPPPDIDEIPISQLEAVEVYRGADTPAELGGLGSSCGTIVLWTRRR